jgi:hypothetical protein
MPPPVEPRELAEAAAGDPDFDIEAAIRPYRGAGRPAPQVDGR